jgi:peptidoglycan/xylan/chitin deacetylase (PgdA/CDA1 family)
MLRRYLTLLAALFALAAPPIALPQSAAAATRPSAPGTGRGHGQGERKPRFRAPSARKEGATSAPRLNARQRGHLLRLIHGVEGTAKRMAKASALRPANQTQTEIAAMKTGEQASSPPASGGKAAAAPALGNAAQARAAVEAEEARKAEAARVAAELAAAEEMAEQERLAGEAEAARLKVEEERRSREAEGARLRREQEAARKRQADLEGKARGKAAAAQAGAADKADGLDQPFEDDRPASKTAESQAPSPDPQADPAAEQNEGADAPDQNKPSDAGKLEVESFGLSDARKAQDAAKQASAAAEEESRSSSRSDPSGRARPPGAAPKSEPGADKPGARAPRESGLDFLARPKNDETTPVPEEPEDTSDNADASTEAPGEPDLAASTPVEAESQTAAAAAPAETLGPGGTRGRNDPDAPTVPRGRFGMEAGLGGPEGSETALALIPPALDGPAGAERAAAMLDAPPGSSGEGLYFSLAPAPAMRGLVLAPMLGPGGAPSGLRPPSSLVLPGDPVMPDADIPKGMDAIERAKTKRKVVALTLDDGPHPEYTSQILSTLARYQVRATFDLVGVQCLKNPQWVKMIAQGGHELASHTYDHFRLPKLPLEEKAYQIDENQRIIGQLTGVTPRFLRPPGGQSDPEVEKLCRQRGMVVALWDVGLNDLAPGRDAKDLAATALADTRPGSILLAHDGSQALIDALPAIIEGLRAKGYEFVTMSELASAR